MRRRSIRLWLAATLAVAAFVAACSSRAEETSATSTVGASTTLARATTSAAPSSTAPATTVPAPLLPPLDDGHLLFFGAVPPVPEDIDYRIPFGSVDYIELFDDDAPWADALAEIDVFRLHAFQLRHYLSDEDLRLIIDWLDEHQIPLLFETEPLQPVDPDECDHSESFEGPWDLEMAARFKTLGGVISAVAIEQPFTYAHKLEGPRVCHYRLERIIGEVTLYMDEMRSLFPDVELGSIEGLVRRPVSTPDDMALWLDTFEELTGEPFAFLHIDVDWMVPEWPEILVGIEAVADARGVPFGVLYNGGTAGSSDGWLQATVEHMARFEVNEGGTPDHTNIVSWQDFPTHVLPDDDLSAFTSVINRWAGTRSVLEPLEIETAADGSLVAEGQLVDLDGNGLGGQVIEATVVEANPLTATATVTGVVPPDADDASVLIRANVEGAVEGDTSFRVYDVSYSEDGGDANHVVNGDFTRGGFLWYIDGDPIGDAGFVRSDVDLDVGSGTMLSVDAARGQNVFVNGEAFPVTAGATFEFTATYAFKPESDGIGTIEVAFLNPDTRSTIRMEPAGQEPVVVTTAADGTFTVPLPDLAGPATVDLTALGDLETWPALQSTRIG